ncbi:MAG TPA: S8 family serine peptidase [Dehalococcoidia bacterium]|nr:S8 family serine peptidase [Dehalococcoidia bacterium]
MKGLVIAIVILSILLVSTGPAYSALAGPPAPSQPPGHHDFVPGELIIKLKPQGLGTCQESDLSSLAALNKKYAVTAMERVFRRPPPTEARSASASAEATPDLSRIYRLHLPQDADVLAIAQEYQASPDVEYAEPNYIVHTALAPDDPYYWSQGSWGQSYQDMWGLHKIEAGAAWDITTGSSEVVIAVVDTGVDYNHEDLAANMWVNIAERDGIAGEDDDDNGYIDDIYGWDFFNGDDVIIAHDNDPADDHGHGTHVAGIIAAVGNNGTGIVGVSWNSRIMAVKFLGVDGQGTCEDGAEAMVYAADNGAKIINLSWGGEGPSQILGDALDYARSRGCLIIAAAGNDDHELGTYKFFPAEDPDVAAVAATDWDDEKASFSNYEHIAVCAPGVDILSLRAANTDMYGNGTHIIDEHYYRASGTSMAAPFVSGLAALVWQQYPDWDAQRVLSCIKASAEDIDEVNPDYAGQLGSGRINAHRALSLSLLQGRVQLQGRDDHSGVIVSAAEYSTVTDDQGHFSLWLPPGSYEVTASHPGYLKASKLDFPIGAAPTADAGLAVLLGGDVAEDYGVIDLRDLAHLAARFNTAQGDPDINGDGVVDIYDLVMVGLNYGKTKSPWP